MDDGVSDLDAALLVQVRRQARRVQLKSLALASITTAIALALP